MPNFLRTLIGWAAVNLLGVITYALWDSHETGISVIQQLERQPNREFIALVAVYTIPGTIIYHLLAIASYNAHFPVYFIKLSLCIAGILISIGITYLTGGKEFIGFSFFYIIYIVLYALFVPYKIYGEKKGTPVLTE